MLQQSIHRIHTGQDIPMMATELESNPRRKWPVALVGIALALGTACLPIGEWDHEFSGIGHLVGNEAIWWIYVAAILLYVRKIERRPLSSIGFRTPGIRNIALGVCAGLLTTTVLGVMYLVVLPLLHLNDAVASSGNAGKLMATPLWWRFISTIRAAVAEEVLFRGYAIERIEELSGSRIAAVVVSCAIFIFAHVRRPPAFE
jgi:membrane protease YdiL (CAAX protease family)